MNNFYDYYCKDLIIFLISSFLSSIFLFLILLNYYLLIHFSFIKYHEIKIKLKKNIIFIKNEYFPEDPDIDIGTGWWCFRYVIRTSKCLFKLKLIICIITVSLILIYFGISRFIQEKESLVLFIKISIIFAIWFYIYCLL